MRSTIVNLGVPNTALISYGRRTEGLDRDYDFMSVAYSFQSQTIGEQQGIFLNSLVIGALP